MKRVILLILIGAALGAGAVWMFTHSSHEAKPDADEAAGEQAGKSDITQDASGDVVINLNTAKQKDAGIGVTNLVSTQLSPELKAYGHVLDPAPLATLMTDLTAAQSAYNASSNDLARIKSLEAQGNASPRALQTAEATAQRDASALQSARDRLFLAWGPALASRSDLPAFVQSLASLEKVLVRLDLPLGEKLESQPLGARIETFSGDSSEAEFLGAALGVDPQAQGHGLIFLIETNTLHLLAGEAVSGYVKTSGAAISGVIVSRDAIVRTDGRGWVYVANSNGESFTRKEIPLERRTDSGWFVITNLAADEKIVIRGAQVLLSQELKSSMSAD